jgi:type IV secretion system protein VirD4
MIVLIIVTVAVATTTGTWLTGQLAALLSHGDWPPVSIWQGLTAAWRLPDDMRNPKMAWPASIRAELPGPAGFLVAGLMATFAVIVIMLVLGGWALSHRPERGFATPAEIRATLSERAVIARARAARPSLRRRPR